jgi:hypothetical protein
VGGKKNFKSCNSMGTLKWSYMLLPYSGLSQMLANILDSYDHLWAKYSMSDEISKNSYFLLKSLILPLLGE